MSASSAAWIAWWKGNIYISYRTLEEMPITDAVYTNGWGATYNRE